MPPKGRPRRKSVAPPIKTTMAEVEPPLSTDVVLEPSSSQTLTPPPPPPPPPPENSNDDVVLGSSSETLASLVKEENIVVNGGDMPVIAKCTTVDDDKCDDGSNDGKPKKKVVKKTIKVVKKVIKKVPKKSVKQGVDSKSGEFDKDCGNLDSNLMISSVVNEEQSKCVTSVSVELKAENSDFGVLDCEKEKVEEKKDEVDEKEVEGESVAMKGSDLMEVENTGLNNGGNVVVEERHGDCGKEGEGEMGEEREGGCQKGDEELGSGEGGKGECGKGDEDLGGGEGGKEEVREGEDEVGEGKLLRGELEAMERKKRRKKEIFVGRLDKDVKEEDVRKVFEEAGEIVDLRLLMNSKTGKKFAFVRYDSAEDAQRALQKFAKVKVCGKECGATPVEGNDTIFLGNVDKKWKDKDVVQLLKKIGIGKIDNVTVMVDPNNTECNRGFAFVEFETINDAQVAYTKLQEKDVFGKNQKIKVAWAEPLRELDEEEMLKVKTVYAEFIPSSWDEEKVKDTFKKFGEIEDIVLARNLRTSKRRDFAFVSYKTRAAAIKCIESFGHDLRDDDGTKINVKVSLAKPKSKSKKLPAAKPFAKEIPRANANTSHSKVRPSVPRDRTQPSVPHYGIRIPEASPTNVELVRLLREQASWRPPHTSLSNNPMDIHPLSGRKRQFSVLEPDPMYEDLNRYRHSRLDASYSAASSSHNLMHPSGLTSPMAYHQRHRGYPSAGSVYEARNFASNAEIRGKPHESSFPYRRCK